MTSSYDGIISTSSRSVTEDPAAEHEVAPYSVDVAQHLLEVPGDRDLVDGMDEAPSLDPVAHRPLRVVAGDDVHAEADEVGHVEAALDAGDDLLRRRLSRLAEEGGRAHPG